MGSTRQDDEDRKISSVQNATPAAKPMSPFMCWGWVAVDGCMEHCVYSYVKFPQKMNSGHTQHQGYNTHKSTCLPLAPLVCDLTPATLHRYGDHDVCAI
jgi:hypothetical protein